MFPRRVITEIKTEHEGPKPLCVDEKALNLKRQMKPAEKPQPKEARAHKYSRSKTVPAVKYIRNGKPETVSFERFTASQALFKSFKSQRASSEKHQFMTDFIQKPEVQRDS